MKDIAAIILAAGEGTRMKSEQPKVLHKVAGKPMLKYMLDILRQIDVQRCIVVVGHRAEKVRQFLKETPNAKTVQQSRLLGSADAVRQTKSSFSKFKGDVLIVYGDTPLVSEQSIRTLVELHQRAQSSCTILTAVLKDPTGYGRIIRGEDNRIVKIVEEQNADVYQRAIGEVNVGAYCFKSKELFSVLEKLKPDRVKKEYYLTDTVEMLSKSRAKVESVSAQTEEEAIGVNSRGDLARANSIINKRNIENLILRGVTVIDPTTTYISQDVEVGQDTVIYPHCLIEGRVEIGKGCQIGPFARLRCGVILEDNVEIGNFVEIVRARVGAGSKIKHHSYIGDAVVGKGVNIGAGTITANYDGKKKNQTFIGDGAFIGVGTILIAPVKVGKKALTGAGSVVTKNKDVPAGVTVAGVPARVLKKNRKQKNLTSDKVSQNLFF